MSAVASIALRPVDPAADAALLHGWVTHPKSVYWQMADADVEAVRAAYTTIAGSGHHRALLGSVDAVPSFLMERYDPARSELADHYEVRPGDVGMHVLVAPTDTPRAGFTDLVFTAVMRELFADPATLRVVVEPDVGNTAIAAKNAAAGFVVARRIVLTSKTAALSFCTREAFAASRLGGGA